MLGGDDRDRVGVERQDAVRAVYDLTMAKVHAVNVPTATVRGPSAFDVGQTGDLHGAHSLAARLLEGPLELDQGCVLPLLAARRQATASSTRNGPIAVRRSSRQ